jgi:flagellar hook-associated protein 2
MLSSPGIGSGLDIGGMISQLMAIEREPLVKLGTEQVELKAQLSAFGKLKSTIASFESTMKTLSDAEQYLQYTATSSDSDVLEVSADENASRGSYRIAVDRLAESQRLAAAGTFADTDATTVGTAGDTLTITVGTDSFTVEFGAKTLAEIRDAINDASDNAGVTASILQDDTGYRLTLSADGTGSANALTLAYNNADPFNFSTLNTDRDGSGGFTAADLDAQLTLEGQFSLTRSSNTISDAIDGVTVTLKETGSSTVTVARDDASTLARAQQFVAGYNEVIKTLSELKGSILAEDRASLRGIESQFRNVLNNKAGNSTNFSYLFEVGLATKLDGTLELNTTTFNKAITRDPEGIADMFANASSGIAVRYTALTETLIGPGGLLDGREDSLNARIRSLDNARASLEARLERKEQGLVRQFSALDALIANLTTTNSYLTQQLSQLDALTKSTFKAS